MRLRTPPRQVGLNPAAFAGSGTGHGSGHGSGFGSGYGYGFSTSDHHDATDFLYLLVDPSDDSMSGTINGRSWEDIRRAVGTSDGEALWFWLDDRDYVVRDAEFLTAAHRILRPMQDPGRMQARRAQ